MVIKEGQLTGEWWFMTVAAGSVNAKGLRDVLQGAHLEGPELFIREVTQNAVDARRSDNSTRIGLNFRSDILSAAQKASIYSFLSGDGSLWEHLKKIRGQDRFPNRGSFFDSMTEDDAEARVLYAEDYGTVGLGGEIGGTSERDHFSRLVYLFGQTHEEGSKGGAFGFGKSVLSVASSVRTVVYYSRPLGVDGKTQESRLISVSLFPGHSYNGRNYTGFALCGREVGNIDFPIYPITGEEADDLAESFGFARRGVEDAGTSIMVLGCDYLIEKIRAAVEKWWWPRIISGAKGRLETRFWKDGEEILGPDPKSDERLRPFVKAYERLLDSESDQETAKIEPIRSIGRRKVGDLSLLALEERPEEEAWYIDSVATFRSPGLVVEYMQVGRSALAPFVGVFVADEEVDPILRRSEPPAHDRWAHESDRLDRDAREDTIVSSVERNTKTKVREFQKQLEPEPVTTTRRFGNLELLLGRVFKRGAAPGPIPPGEERPVHIRVTERRDYENNRDEAAIEISAREKSEQVIPARLEVEVHVLGDANRRALDRIDAELRDNQDRLLDKGLKLEHTFEVPTDGKISFLASASSGFESIVRFRVRVVGV